MCKSFSLSVFISLVFFAFAASAAAQMRISGEVIDVIDGKTVLVAIPSGDVKVELQYIDVPEAGQQLYDTVREHLRRLTVGKPVEYRPKTLLGDRAIGQLKVKGVDISQQMLRDGAAWHFSFQGSGQERPEYEAYASTEAAAKTEKLGVWSIPGLKPSWELRADQETARQREQDSIPSRPSTAAPTTSARVKVTPPSNPAFGDVGSLLNRYDPQSKTGVLSTSLLPLEMNKTVADLESIAVDISYYYKETDQNKRSGSFVVTAVFLSKNSIFAGDIDVVLMDLDKEKKVVVGRAKRTVANQNYLVRETMVCELSRTTLERIAMNEGMQLKIGQHTIHMTGGRYLLYNLLQVTQ